MKPTTVIGAGFGGPALAIRLQAAGIPVLLLEQRDKPGGRAYVYEDQGFTFDAGPTVITDPSAIEELFALAGKQLKEYVELLPVTPFYRLCWESGKVFNYDNDQTRLEAQIQQFNPRDVEGYRQFLDYSRAVFKEGYLKLGTVPFYRSETCFAPHLNWRNCRHGEAFTVRLPVTSKMNICAGRFLSTRCWWAAIPSPPHPFIR